MRILEAGHYYAVKGPTIWSRVGWNAMKGMSISNDRTMLFVDDIHDLTDLSEYEANLPTVDFKIIPDFIVMESEVVEKARQILETLKRLNKNRRARISSSSGKWHCSGFPLTTASGEPNCVLLDAGLTLFKQELGFKKGVNILPMFYEEQQRKLLRIVSKAMPDFSLKVVLYDIKGNLRELCGND
ncbi:MAG TPA: hypothetical protein VMV71_04250 [Candidatus Paceibacterota bacterium]|nr:hypothetical protein [Candidatus Paceibacterota bacterium]